MLWLATLLLVFGVRLVPLWFTRMVTLINLVTLVTLPIIPFFKFWGLLELFYENT